MLNSPVDGTSISLPLDCKSVVQPLVEDLFINHAYGPGRLSRPTLHKCHLLDCGPSFFAGDHAVIYLVFIFQGKGQRRAYSVHILDAVMLCGVDIRDLHFNERYIELQLHT